KGKTQRRKKDLLCVFASFFVPLCETVLTIDSHHPKVKNDAFMLSDFTGIVQQGTREEALLNAVAWDRLPRHVAIIMDGNGRWAAQRGQPRIAGHKAGVEAVRAAVDTGARL